MALRYILALVLCVIGATVSAEVLAAKGSYCRDPDTGKLYPVNSTWSSTTFCGRYSCKLRKVNKTIDSVPLTQINITDLRFRQIQPLNDTQSTKHDACNKENEKKVLTQNVQEELSSEAKLSELRKKFELLKSIHQNKKQLIHIKNDDIRIETKESGKDHVGNVTEKKKFKIVQQKPIVVDHTERENETIVHKDSNVSVSKEDNKYLNEDEMKMLMLLLQNIKKSDLEAMLEVYNLAQDIYKEIDKTTDQNIIEETLRELQNNKMANPKHTESSTNNKQDGVSYWYEPLSHANNKQSAAPPLLSNLVPVIPPVSQKVPHILALPFPPILIKPTSNSLSKDDISYEGSAKIPVLIPSLKPKQSYFIRPISHSDFNKMPHFYPLPSINRPSYSNPNVYFSKAPDPVKINPIRPVIDIEGPAPRQPAPVAIKPLCRAETQQKSKEKEENTKKTKLTRKDRMSFMDNPDTLLVPYPISPKRIQPTILPYPFVYLQSYNMSAIPNPYININPWQVLSMKPQQSLQLQSYKQPPSFIANIPNTILVNPDSSEKVRNIIQQGHDTKNVMPEWLTGPVPNNVLNDVKANIAVKSKILPLPLRKRFKLEKVSKVVKTDESSRPKRSVQNKELSTSKERREEYEAYVEKSTSFDFQKS